MLSDDQLLKKKLITENIPKLIFSNIIRKSKKTLEVCFLKILD